MNNKGIALVTVLIVIGTIMALISILFYTSKTSNMLNINFKNYLQDFFLGDGALKIEDVKVITINVSNISEPNVIGTGTTTFPYTNKNYTYQIRYEFFKQHISPGTSLSMFNDYFYSIRVDIESQYLKEFVSKIGPTIH